MNAVETFYVIVNLTAITLTVWALWDAIGARRTIYALNGRARELLADAVVRREVVRLGVQTVLLILAIPALFAPGDTKLSLPVVALIAVAVLVLLGSALDAWSRRLVLAALTEDHEP